MLGLPRLRSASLALPAPATTAAPLRAARPPKAAGLLLRGAGKASEADLRRDKPSKLRPGEQADQQKCQCGMSLFPGHASFRKNKNIANPEAHGLFAWLALACLAYLASDRPRSPCLQQQQQQRRSAPPGRRRQPGCCCEVQARRPRPIRGEESQASQGLREAEGRA